MIDRRFSRPARGTQLPANFDLEEDGDLLWLTRGGHRVRVVGSYEEAVHAAMLLIAFVPRFVERDDWPETDWPKMGEDFLFEGEVPLSEKPEPVSPKFRFFWRWLHFWPSFGIELRADYASYLVFRVAEHTPAEQIVRQTDPALAWCYFFLAEQIPPAPDRVADRWDKRPVAADFTRYFELRAVKRAIDRLRATIKGMGGR